MQFSHFTVTRSGKDRENKKVLSLDLKADKRRRCRSGSSATSCRSSGK